MSTSKIEWTERTWNPLSGCDKVSTGCEHCYALRMSWRHQHNPMIQKKYEGTVRKTPGGQLQWTGRINLHEDVLREPLSIRKPTTFFVNSMSDLFHKDVPFHFIDQVFAAMACCPQHTFQILTKRPERMLEWFRYKDKSWTHEGMQGDERIRYQTYHTFGKSREVNYEEWKWPLPNVWLGTSCEDQKAANQRILPLIRVPAAVRFLSCEPLIGPININSAITWEPSVISKLHWVIAGGESGTSKARPMHPDWVRSLRDQCTAAEVPFFFKQWGEWLPSNMPLTDSQIHVRADHLDSDWHKEGNMNWVRVGKHAAGRTLDRLEWNEYPPSIPETALHY